MSDEIRKWEKHASRVVSDHRIFKIREDHTTNPRTGSEHEMVVLECPDWVNIIALTPEREVVFVEQYRQGSETVELEIPGGMMDPGETDPVATALRELREETGYTGENAPAHRRMLRQPRHHEQPRAHHSGGKLPTHSRSRVGCRRRSDHTTHSRSRHPAPHPRRSHPPLHYRGSAAIFCPDQVTD